MSSRQIEGVSSVRPYTSCCIRPYLAHGNLYIILFHPFSIILSRRLSLIFSLTRRWLLLLLLSFYILQGHYLWWFLFQGRRQQGLAGLVSWLWLFDDNTVLWYEWWLWGGLRVGVVKIFVCFGLPCRSGSCSCAYVCGGPVFIRRGWGVWLQFMVPVLFSFLLVLCS